MKSNHIFWHAPFLALLLLMFPSNNGLCNAFSLYQSVVRPGNRHSSNLSNAISNHDVLIQIEKLDNDICANSGTEMGLLDRPLLQKFGKGINNRILQSRDGENCLGQTGAYTSEETIPCLDMQVQPGDECKNSDENHPPISSSKEEISMAFTESSRCQRLDKDAHQQARHGRSSGSGCSIIRLSGNDASSIHGLIEYANRFFDRVDGDDENVEDIGSNEFQTFSTDRALEKPGDAVKNAGVFRIDNHVYAGFDEDVNGEGKMQFLDTRIVCDSKSETPIILPMEVGDLVGDKSICDAHKGMETLLDIGCQITSAVLGLDDASAEKLIDDGTSSLASKHKIQQSTPEDRVSNSYHRLVRYLQPLPNSGGELTNASFQAHVDSSFLTLIPMPELPGLEVWCPKKIDDSIERGIGYSGRSTIKKGEWVRPKIPASDCTRKNNFPLIDKDIERSSDGGNEGCAYVIAMAGEFMQLVSDGEVPVCIHRVIPPTASSKGESETSKHTSTEEDVPYKMRISAPLFLRPRRDEDAVLDVEKDLKRNEKTYDSNKCNSDKSITNLMDKRGLYHEKGLLKECDSMHLWSAHEMMMSQ